MAQSTNCVIALLLLINFFACMSISGYSFLINQYIYFRYLEDAGLPYNSGEATNCKTLHSSNGSVITRVDPRDEAQSQTAYLLGWTSFLSLGISMIAGVLVGFLSDLYGRLPAIALVLLGQGLNHILIAFMVLLHLDVLVLAAAATVVGVIGGGYVTLIVQISVCFADLTNIPEPETAGSQEKSQPTRVSGARINQGRDRLILFGMFDATAVLSGALGPGIMGTVIDHFGFVTSVLGLLAIYCVPVVLIWFLPETRRFPSTMPVNSHAGAEHSTTEDLPETIVSPAPSTSSIGFCALLNVFKSSHPATLIVFIVLFVYSLVALTENHYLFLYLMAQPLCWTAEAVGLYSGIGSMIMAFASLGLTLVTAYSMRSTPVTVGTPHSNISSMSGSTVALVRSDDDENYGGGDPGATPICAASVDWFSSSEKLHTLQSRLRMLIYVFVGLLMLMISKIVMGSAVSLQRPYCTAAAIVALAIGLVRAALVPTLKSYLSTLHSAAVQGRLFSLIGITEYAGLLIGIPGFSAFYAATVALFPGAVFFFSASLCLIALFFVVLLAYHVIKEIMELNRIIRNTPVLNLGS